METNNLNRFKIAVITICLNKPYWEFLSPMIASARQHLLKGHEVDFICWTDMPSDMKIDAKIIPTESHPWPTPTLQRYSLFLREEELLKEYDYIFYCDADMKFVSRVGNEILGEGLTSAVHPMYYIKQNYIPPYEPDKKSTAYIPRPGRIIEKDGKKRLQPLYYAGGFQGGRSDMWISAMKEMKAMIDKDFMENNYVAVWNDESYWNKYLLDNPPSIVLNPSYIYPDSLIREYYIPLWGRNYCPKLITLTKQFSLTKEGGQAINQMLR